MSFNEDSHSKGKYTNYVFEMNIIKEILEQRGIKQIWQAEKISKCYKTINVYAQNRQQPRLETLMEIANNLDVDVKEFIISNKDQN